MNRPVVCAVLLLALCLVPARLPAGSAGRAETVEPAPASEYRLELSLDQRLRQLSGSLALRWMNRTATPLERLQFLLFPNLTPGGMEILRCSIGGAAAVTSSRMRGALLDVRLPARLPAGGEVEVAIDYRLILPDDAEGRYAGLTSTGGIACLANCYPVVLDPASWDGAPPVAWADFLVKEASAYRVRLEAPAGLVVAAAGEVRRLAAARGRQAVEIVLEPARDFFAAVGSAWSEASSTTGAVEVRAVAPARDGATAMADIARAALAVFERRFGPYPYRSFVVVAAPFAALGLEFPGAALVADRLLDAGGSTGGVSNRVMLEATLVHEVAHQWFYNLVGNDQVREPWLDEALAQYAVQLYYLDRGGPAAAEALAASFGERWDRVDRAPLPVGMPASSYSAKEYGAIVYGRGPLFLQALAGRMGSAAFDLLLRQWVDAHRWRIATGGDFLALAREICGCDPTDLFEEWVWP